MLEIRKILRREQGNGTAHPQPRSAPQGMPRNVPDRGRTPRQAPQPKDVLPPQEALTDEEAAPLPPKRWRVILKRVGLILLGFIALALVYVFLLLGEPDNLETQTPTAAPQELIRVPMAAVEASASADLSALAASFGKPVLALYGGLTLEKCSLYDTAFQGAYARRVTLQYTFEDGQVLLVESLRPAQAVTLLGAGGEARLNLEGLYALAGVDAVRMDKSQHIYIFGERDGAVYAITCPQSRSADLGPLLKQTTLLQPKAPGT